MIILDFLPEAFGEAEAAVAYYEERGRGLGARLRVQIETALASIVDHPHLWSERSGGYRRVNLPGFPIYAYFVRGERVIVAAVGHASRHPGYWKKRATKINR